MQFHLAICVDFDFKINPNLLGKILMVLVYML